MRLVFALCCILWHVPCMCGEPSSKFTFSMPVDQRTWRPVDPLLPYQQSVLWIAPEGDVARKEFLVIRKGPIGSKTEHISVTTSEIDPAHLFARKSTPSGELALAVDNLATGHFTALRFFQGPDAVYEIRYEVPAKLLSQEDKQAWWERINQATADSSPNDSSWMSITPSGIFRNKVPVESSEKWVTYRHTSHPFSVELPESWLCEETSWKQNRAVEGPGFTSFLTFTRIDNLAFGSVSIAVSPHPVSDEQVEQDWKQSIQYMNEHPEPIALLSHGDFKGGNSPHDKFVITADGDSISWKVFHTQGVNTYKIEVWSDKANLPALRETFLKILKGFKVQRSPA